MNFGWAQRKRSHQPLRQPGNATTAQGNASFKSEYKNRVSMERPRGRLTGIDPKEQIIEADR